MAKIFKYKKEIVHLSSLEDLKQTSHQAHPATGTRLSPRHLETSVAPYPGGGVSPSHLETRVSPYPAAGAGVSPRHLETGAGVSTRHLEAGIGWVDLHPDGGLCQTGIEDYNQISQSQSSKKILEKALDLEKNKSQSGSMEPEDTKKKRRRFRPRNRRRGGTDHHSRRKGEDAHLESDFRIGRTDNIERRGKKRKLDRVTEDGDDFGRRRYGGHNDIDVRPTALDPRQVEKLDPRQVEKYILEDPALSSKRRRIDRNSRNCEGKRGKGILGSPPRGSSISGSSPRGNGIFGSPPSRGKGIFGSPPSRGNGFFGSAPAARNKLGGAPGIVYSPTELRKLQTEKTAMKWPSFLSPCCKNKRGFWDPFIFHAKTSEEVRKNGSGAAAVNVTVKRNLTRDIREAKKGLENSDMKNGTNNLKHSSDISRVSSTELFKKDIKDIVRKTLSAQPIPKEVELGKLFQSEMENIDSPDNFSDNDFGEDLFNLPEPVPALKKNSNHNKISAFTDLPQPVPAHKINSDINKKSTFEIIKAMKTVRCQVKINPKSEIRDAIADEVRILKNLDQIKEEERKTVDHGVNLSLAIDNIFDESTNFNISVPADDTIAGSAVNKITESVDNIADPADHTIAKPSDVKIDKLAHNKIYEPTDFNIAETSHEPDSISKPVDNNLAKLDDDKTVKSAYNNLGEPTDNNVAKPVDSKINKYSDKNIAVIAQIKDDCGTEIKIEKLEAMHNILDQSKAINREVMHNENNQIDLENEQDLGENVTVDEMGRKEAALFLAWLPKETDKNDVIDDGKVNVETGEMVESEEFALKCDFGEFDVKYCFICEEYDHFMREECLICKSCGQKLTAASAKGHYIKECSKNTVTSGAGDISSKIEIKIQAP